MPKQRMQRQHNNKQILNPKSNNRKKATNNNKTINLKRYPSIIKQIINLKIHLNKKYI